MSDSDTFEHVNDVAIIGMSGRFPGARNTGELWQNLCAGRECISYFTREELEACGIDRSLLDDPNYVRAKGTVEDADTFDAAFFGYSPREAEIMDPQQRLFLESAWEALEDAGYDAEQYEGRIGVFGGVGLNTYLIQNLLPNHEFMQSVGDMQYIAHGNDKDYVTTRVSYKLGLNGPSVNIQSACSTSLVAVCIAYQSLLSGESDMALAGGAFINTPLKAGYLYRVGSIVSPDGHCRAFDAKAGGTVFGDGVGVVVLKRLADALGDGDTIYAVIKGTALNNDGSAKVSYTAPSVQSQAQVIAEAMAIADVDPETISYVETHGTGTLLGDPIEMTALNQAFRTATEANGFCAIGSAKTAIGHLDAAAGVAGLIKASLALKHKLLPPSLNFEQPNPQIDFANSPFYVNTELSRWKANGAPRRAGVSSFGVGGTNAHVVLEEAPSTESSAPFRPYQVLMLSAKTETALDAATERLAQYLQEHRDVRLADVAYTLQVGRKRFDHRRTVVCRNVDDAIATLRSLPDKYVATARREPGYHPVAFMFSGQGAQYVNMGLGLYQTEPAFRETINRCAEILKPLLGLDLREVMYADTDRAAEAEQRLQQTALTQPAIFTIEYALAGLWMEWGIEPQAVIGHSIGEYAAACLAGVFSLEDGLALVAERGRLMQALPGGTMLVVFLSEKEVQPYLSDKVSLAVINGPDLCVLAGPPEAIATVQSRLAERKVKCRALQTSHAFHSAMMDPMLEAFAERVRQVDLQPPRIRYASNLTADWATTELTDPEYWVRHVRQTVRFAEGVQCLFQEPGQILLEVGPGQTLSTLAKRHPARAAEQAALDSLRHPQDEQPDMAYMLGALGKLWLEGVQVDWDGFYAHERRGRLALPTYPFERKRYWVDAQIPARAAGGGQVLDSNATPAASPPDGEGDEAPALPTYEGAPRDEVECKVAEIWQSVLGIQQVKVTDDFFELGGHSMLAVSVFARIKAEMDTDLPLAALLQAPTLEQFADVVRREDRSMSRTSLMPIQPEGTRPPFYCVHGHRGQVLFCTRLTRHMRPDQPFYAFQRQGLEGDHPYHTRVVEMAAHYVKELRAFQPRGPYYLGGFCMGGPIAYEMAQQLLAQGQEVALLVLLDATNDLGLPKPSLAQSMGAHLRNLVHLGWRGKAAYARLKGGAIVETLKHKFAGDEQETSTVKTIAGDPPPVVRDYVPRPYPGRIILIRGNDQPVLFYCDPYLGWEGLAEGGIHLERLPVERGYVVDEPYARDTAVLLQAYIDEALATRSAEAAPDEASMDAFRVADAIQVVEPVGVV